MSDKKSPGKSHCNLARGDKLCSHLVGERAGHGRHSTVWKVHKSFSEQAHAAAKVFRCKPSDMDHWRNEIRAMQTIHSPYICEYYGADSHVSFADGSPNIHPVILFRLAPMSLKTFVRKLEREDRDLPICTVMKIMTNVFRALQDIHAHGFIHTDIKRENILLMNADIESALTEPYAILADLGAATPETDLFTQNVGTDGFLPPEAILRLDYDRSLDAWEAAVTVLELITGDLLFDPYNDTRVIYHDDIDPLREDWIDDSESSDSTAEHTEQYRSLYMINIFLGPCPVNFAKQHPEHYDAAGHPVADDCPRVDLAEFLAQNYSDFDPDDIDAIVAMVAPVFRHQPADRAGISHLLESAQSYIIQKSKL